MAVMVPAVDEARGLRIVAWSLVLIQFSLIGLLVLGRPGTLWPTGGVVRVVGLMLVVAGAVVMGGAAAQIRRALTASPLPNARTVLVDTGWYRRVRHPIYSGLIATGAGLTVLRASVLAVACLAALVVLLEAKARFEEAVLAPRFSGYAAYRARTGRLLPRLGPPRS